jgi:hypothetical protein
MEAVSLLEQSIMRLIVSHDPVQTIHTQSWSVNSAGNTALHRTIPKDGSCPSPFFDRTPQ